MPHEANDMPQECTVIGQSQAHKCDATKQYLTTISVFLEGRDGLVMKNSPDTIYLRLHVFLKHGEDGALNKTGANFEARAEWS